MRYLITFSYDGTNFYGYQKQLNKRTVQNELENVLTTINKKNVSITASGRTDAGVHAINQKAHFDLDFDIPCDKLKKALNTKLPDDIYIKDIAIVSDNFHARFNVKSKEYIYKINVGEYNPIEKNYIYQYNKNLDISKMKKAIKKFKGEHNFKSFTSAKDIRNDYVRKIMKADIAISGDIVTISFVGTGFLRYMVRNMVGLLIEIGEGKAIDVNKVLKEEDRTKASKTAHPEGLYLKDVRY